MKKVSEKNQNCKSYFKVPFNRYRRGLKTCPQANLVQSVQAIFFFFFPPHPSEEYDSAPSRNYTAHFGPFSPVSVKPLKRNGAKRVYKNSRKESFSIYVYKVLNEVHPDTGVFSKAMTHHELLRPRHFRVHC